MNNEAQRNEERKLVKQLGDEIGYGNLMSLASEIWKEYSPRDAFTVGPCAVAMVPCGHPEDGSICDWCCGTGMLTRHVKNVKDNLESKG